MSMRLPFNVLALGIYFVYATNFGQTTPDKITYYDSTVQLENIGDLASDEDYESLLQEIDKVHPSDSLYGTLLNTKIITLIQLKRYEEGLKIAEEALEQDVLKERINLFINKGICLKGIDQNKEAIDNYLEALKEYPLNHKLHFNLGISYEEEGVFKKAADAYMQTITYAPLFEKAHLRLGNLYLKEGRLAQALLCYNMYLVSSPDGAYSFSVLKAANEIARKDQDLEKNNVIYTPDDEVFEEIDLILNNRIALQKGFEAPTKIDLPYTKQNYALLSQLENVEGNGGFFAEKYIPFFRWIYDNDHFEAFIYTTSYSIENETYKRVVEKQVDEIKDFISKAFPKWLAIMRSDNKIKVDGNEQLLSFEYQDGFATGLGELKEDKVYGPWIYYDENGKPKAKGSFNDNGEKEGDWQWFFPNGNLDETGTYKNGKENGLYTVYYPNGKKKIEVIYLDGIANGTYSYYNNKGALLRRSNYVNNTAEGLSTEYYDVGETLKKYEYTQDEGTYVGEYIEHHTNGKTSTKGTFLNGKKSGLETQYYVTGDLFSEYQYSNGLLNGTLKNYHVNGQLSSQGKATDNEYSGPWITYHSNGKIKDEFNYDNGSLNGLYKTYDRDGKLHNTFEYRKGEIRSYTYYDKGGQEIINARKKNGEFLYKGYDPYGLLLSEGLYDIKGGKTGFWKFYHRNEVLSEEGNYEDDLTQGAYKTYHKNGKLKSESNYKNDTLQGYSKQWYSWGQLQHQGYYKDGLAQGLWEYYYPDGTLESENFFHKGKFNGVQKYYGVSGKLKKETFYDFGNPEKEMYYTAEGISHETIDYTMPKNMSTYHHPNGKIQSQYQMLNDVNHGAYKAFDYYGNKIVEGGFFNGEREGKWLFYNHGDGILSSEANYLNGSRHGASIWYHENGEKETSYNHIFGSAQGEKLDFAEDGTINTTSQYVDDELHGRKIFYSDDGTLQLIRFYDMGRFTGYTYLDENGEEVPQIKVSKETAQVIGYFKNGEKSRVYTIDNGLLQGKHVTYYSSGKLEKELNYVDDEYHQSQNYYSLDGQLHKTENYLYGNEHGTFSYYYPNGKLKKEVNYRNGSKSGYTHYYNQEGGKIKSEFYFNDDINAVETY